MEEKTFKTDNRIISIMNKYSGNSKLGDLLSKITKKGKLDEIIIPVLGLQGMGKSTLINAILSENILPSEADETTCVPIEIKYGKDEKALVYFKDSKENLKIFTREELNEYVDNAYNPGNEKKVSHIVLFRDIEILKGGATIVDLPGVGSLTKENQETTMRYIKNLNTAIFVIPTTPTIRRREENFIKSVWMQFTSAIFVQNNFGETEREVLESVEFNTKVLENISNSINTNFNEEIIVVNAYDALLGKVNKDKNLIEESNIKKLTEKLSESVDNWNEKEEKNIENRIRLLINESKKQIKNYIYEASLSREQLSAKHKEEEEISKKSTEELEEKVEEIEELLDDKEYEVKKFARREARECAENIRINIFRLIDQGLVDGEILMEAFNQLQDDYISEVINKFFDLKEQIAADINKKIKELEEILNFENDFSVDPISFNCGDAFKYEKGLEAGFNIAGGIGGLLIFGAFGGPVGIAIGIGVSIVASLLGNKAKNTVTKKRGSETKKEIEKIIDRLEKQVKEEIIESYKKVAYDIKKVLEIYIKDRKKAFEEIKATNLKEVEENFKTEFNLEELEADYKYLNDMESEIYE